MGRSGRASVDNIIRRSSCTDEASQALDAYCASQTQPALIGSLLNEIALPIQHTK